MTTADMATQPINLKYSSTSKNRQYAQYVRCRKFFCFPNAVWSSAESGDFRIVSDTLVYLAFYVGKRVLNLAATF